MPIVGSLQDRVVIVTGGSGGIGLATARAFVAAGACVSITGRRREILESLTADEPRLAPIQADATEPADAERTIKETLDRWGRLDVLVNNAGAGIPMLLEHATMEQVQTILSTNVIGPSLLAAAAVTHLEPTRGSIINISSSLARKPVAMFSHYAASKAALEHLTRCWAMELAPKGIRVNAVAAGPVETSFLRDRMGYSAEAAEAIREQERNAVPLKRRGEPEDIAPWIVALADESARWVTGQVFGVDGGFSLV